MDIIIKSINSKKDVKFLSELANRMGLKSVLIGVEESNEFGMGLAIQDGMKSGYVSEKKVMKTLRKIKRK